MHTAIDTAQLKKVIDATRTRLLNQHSYMLSPDERAYVAGTDVSPSTWLDQLQRMENEMLIRSRTWRTAATKSR